MKPTLTLVISLLLMLSAAIIGLAMPNLLESISIPLLLLGVALFGVSAYLELSEVLEDIMIQFDKKN